MRSVIGNRQVGESDLVSLVDVCGFHRVDNSKTADQINETEPFVASESDCDLAIVVPNKCGFNPEETISRWS
ncbi:hypothetical protein D3C83_176250 [compost metagenome]